MMKELSGEKGCGSEEMGQQFLYHNENLCSNFFFECELEGVHAWRSIYG